MRVGWSGGASHYEDIYSIKDQLNQALRKYQFTLVFAGHDFSGIIDEDLRHLVETHSWIPFLGHSYHIMSLAIDIAIIPLADLPFNQYKSPIKYFEFSALKIPSVISNITPYKEVINFDNAYPYKNDFYKQLELAIKDSDLRKTRGENAYKLVYNNYNSKDWSNKQLQIYKKLL